MQNIIENVIYYEWISSRLGTCSAAFKRLMDALGCGKSIYEQTDYTSFNLTQKQTDSLMDKKLGDAKKSAEKALGDGMFILTYEDERYPQKLKDISTPPPILYCKGNYCDFDKYFCVGIVGTRNASREAMEFTEKISAELAKKGVIIISGLARGIDTTAHAATIGANGFTAGISGVKAGQIYPPENRFLYENLYIKGLVICENSPTANVQKSAFPSRNRIIGALCDGLIMVEAPQKSGALITADKTKAMKKPVFVPHGSSKTNAGGLNLLEKGAIHLSCSDDIITVLTKNSQGTQRRFLTNEEMQGFHKNSPPQAKQADYSYDLLREFSAMSEASNKSDKSAESIKSEKNTIYSNTKSKIKPEIKSERNSQLTKAEGSFQMHSPEFSIAGLSKTENQVYSFLLSNSEVSTDHIIYHLKLSSVDVASATTMLELLGYIKRMPGDKWCII